MKNKGEMPDIVQLIHIGEQLANSISEEITIILEHPILDKVQNAYRHCIMDGNEIPLFLWLFAVLCG